MRRLPLALLVALAASVTGPLPADAAAQLEIREASGAVFPDRSYVVSLPDRRPLRAADVEVTENGGPVDRVRVLGGPAAESGVVLVIDASRSMQGQPIADAMAAARAFADRRRPEQKLGVVFFSRDAHVALAPTDDPAQIEAALKDPPEISSGTRITDATKAAVDVLQAAGVEAGSVVVLSDGCRATGGRCAPADAGTDVSTADVVAAAEAGKVKIFSVGLRSPTYDEQALRSLATGGRYIEAAQSGDLSSIFRRLGERFGNEYLITYRSLSPIGSQVGVGVRVDGVPGLATAAYQTPDLRLGRPDSVVPQDSAWRSSLATALVALLVSLLVGIALMLVARERKRTVAERIASFVFNRPEEPVLEVPERERRGLRALIEGWLKRRGPWQSFELDVEIARLKWTPMQIAGATVAASLLAAGVCVLLDRVVLAALIVVSTPPVVRLLVRYVASKWRMKFAEQLPDNLSVIASALRAGHSFVGALKTMADDAPEPSRTEYRRVLSEEQLGVPIEESLNVVAARMKNEEVSYIGLIATLQRETGGNTAEVLDRVTHTIRERMKLRRLVRTLTAQGRAGGYIVTALPIAMLVFLNVVKPEYMDPMTETTTGWIVLIVGGLMVAAGAFAIRKIVDIDV